jgi:hypothetical protein
MPPIQSLDWTVLVGKCVCLSRIIGRLRFREIEQMDADESDPTEKGWELLYG